MQKLGNCLIVATALVSTWTDGSGQDARFYSRQADHEFFKLGRVPQALKLYEVAFKASVNTSDIALQTKILNNVGAMQLALFRYREAELTLLQVRKMAKASHDDMM